MSTEPPSAPGDWQVHNHRFLSACLSRVRAALEAHAASTPLPEAAEAGRDPPWTGPARRPPAILALAETFHLTPFERDTLILCAGVELDAAFPDLCARAAGDPYRAYPTWSLALAALPGPHWDALSPSAPLRRWGLIEVDPAAPSAVLARLRAPERVWQFLLGIDHPDERLIRCLAHPPEAGPLAPSHERLAERIAAVCDRAGKSGPPPLALFAGRSRAHQTAIAARAAARLGLSLLPLAAETLPLAMEEVDRIARLARRDAALSGQAILLDCHSTDPADPARSAAILHFAATCSALSFVAARERWAPGDRPAAVFDVDSPTPEEQRASWIEAIASPAADPAWLEATAATLAAEFDLDPPAQRTAAARAAALLDASGDPGPGARADALWDACRAECRPRLEGLAQRIEPRAGWDDLVLPEEQTAILRDVELFARRRALAASHEAPGTRGRGTTVVLSGPSGTGKTLAAEVLAGRLRLDLHRVDLAAVVSKYVGDTEKNLRRVFDAAERGGAVLLFDEADALFGRRSEVRDSHDRYANIEVSYLLQRLEAFRGLSILTTNRMSAIDEAFLRRIRFVVELPFPEEPARQAIWRRALPSGPRSLGLDFARLAQLHVSGASIVHIATHAALLAAEEAAPVQMRHALAAARREYDKLKRPLTRLETRGWATGADEQA